MPFIKTVPVAEQLLCNMGLRLDLDTHQRLCAYAATIDATPAQAIRTILRHVLRAEEVGPPQMSPDQMDPEQMRTAQAPHA